MSSKSSDDNSSSGNFALDEWKEIRSVFARLDENLHDLRKYGFVFLASLFAVDSIQTYFSLPEFTRCMLLIITIAFIVSLRLLDHNYQTLETAAELRSRILEVNLDIEITETIAEHYKSRFGDFVTYLYYGFTAITILLGSAILFPASSFSQPKILLSVVPYFAGFLIAALVGIFCLKFISRDLSISYGRLYDGDYRDWILDRVSCKQGENVKITVTSLGSESVFAKDSIAFTIRDDTGNYLLEEKVKEKIVLGCFQNHSWLWNTNEVKPNRIYRVIPGGRAKVEGRESPLRRTIIVYPNDSQTKP